MTEIAIRGGEVEVGTVTVDTGEYGYEVRIEVTSVAGACAFGTGLTLDLAGARKLHAAIGEAIAEAQVELDAMVDEVEWAAADKESPDGGDDAGPRYAMLITPSEETVVRNSAEILF